MADAPYHHGDLRAALLREAEAELSEKGVEKFSLRGVAKRAGVSHAAPAHHFGDANGLLTALAALGFQKFAAAQEARRAKAGPSPEERLTAGGLGYLDFALERPALYLLMFASDRVDTRDRDYKRWAEEAFGMLVEGVKAHTGEDPSTSLEGKETVLAAWSMVHGLAGLLAAGRPYFMAELNEAEREEMVANVIRRAVAAPPR